MIYFDVLLCDGILLVSYESGEEFRLQYGGMAVD